MYRSDRLRFFAFSSYCQLFLKFSSIVFLNLHISNAFSVPGFVAGSGSRSSRKLLDLVNILISFVLHYDCEGIVSCVLFFFCYFQFVLRKISFRLKHERSRVIFI
ncbi:hypothetical protein Y032_0017g3300 [Ancylostoma ceylanicum]|uniref:Uncharacterized protein n=1 Tax=Ancylostoma ceylanicum TaxID=53326 RepID=A0A016V5Q4_9BILA|nr:hypothetical protein Y032_0017g3300 [Ancylostoma ceylanicum]